MDIISATGLVYSAASHAATNAAAVVAAQAANPINWTLLGGILACLIPILISVVTIILKIYGEKTKVAESVLRESPVIQSIQENQRKSDETITEKIVNGVNDLTEKIREANTSRETFRNETNRSLEQNRHNIEELRTMIYQMRSNIEIMRNENDIQNRSIEELRNDNRELVNRLEGLVRELYDYLNSSG